MRIFIHTIGLLTAIQSGVHAGKAPIKNAANESEEKKRYMLESQHTRSLRGSTDSTSSSVIENELRNLIIGGKEIQKNEYPYLAFLTIFKPDEKNPEICGGTLIQPNWILTAAHCAYGALNITAMLGVHDTSTSAGEPGVEQYFIHQEDIHIYPVYDSRLLDGDFSLLYLKTASNKTTPIVNTDIFVPAEGDTVSVVGWGRYDVEWIFPSNVPLEANLEVIDSVACKVAYADMIIDNTVAMTNDMICATGWAKSSVCNGDSGGPVVKKDSSGNPSKDVLIGVVSFSEGCNKPNRPDVYGRVSAAMSWLTTMISPSSTSPGPTIVKITNPIASSLDPTPAVLTSPEPSSFPVTSIPSRPPSPRPKSLSWSFNLT